MLIDRRSVGTTGCNLQPGVQIQLWVTAFLRPDPELGHPDRVQVELALSHPKDEQDHSSVVAFPPAPYVTTVSVSTRGNTSEVAAAVKRETAREIAFGSRLAIVREDGFFRFELRGTYKTATEIPAERVRRFFSRDGDGSPPEPPAKELAKLLREEGSVRLPGSRVGEILDLLRDGRRRISFTLTTDEDEFVVRLAK